MINVYNGKTLVFTVDKDVKYTDVVSGGEVIIMVMLVSGDVNDQVQKPFMKLKNNVLVLSVEFLALLELRHTASSLEYGWIKNEF